MLEKILISDNNLTAPIQFDIDIVEQMIMKPKFSTWLVVFLCVTFILPFKGFCQNSKTTPSVQASKKLTLDQAAMCEAIKELAPHNPAVVFSIKIGKVSCFTSFDPVPAKTFIYHKWYHKDKLSTKKRLSLTPPRWSTYTSILLRETDKGPWRVEIYNQKGDLFQILRFSITD